MSNQGDQAPFGGSGGAGRDDTGAWPPDWYADPWSPGQQRYWDGRAWTAHVAPAPPPAWAAGTAGAPAWGTPVPAPGAGAPAWGTPAPAPGAGAPAWGTPPAGATSSGPAPMWGNPSPEAPAWGNPSPDGPAWGTPAASPAPGSSAAAGGSDTTLTATAPLGALGTDPSGGPSTWPGSTVPPGAPWSGGSYLPPGATWPGEAPPPPPARRGGVPWVAVLGAMVVVALVAGVVTVAVHSSKSSSHSSPPTIPIAPSTSVPAGNGPAASSDPDASVLPRLAVGQSDVGTGVTTGLINGGDQVAGEPTLDLCNGTFASEQLRTARRQTAVANASGQIVFSTEAVLYQSPNGTAEAFTELRRVQATCPPAPVSSPVGEPTVKTTFRARPDGSWPQAAGVERLAYDFDTVDQQGQSQHEVVTYLRRGRVLMGLYFSQPDSPQTPVAGQTTIPGIVGVFAARLAALPASAVTRTYNPGTSASAPAR